MSTEAALLAAIAKSPAEDTPRLALADWYDEHRAGEPHLACEQRLAVLLRAIKAAPADDAPRLEYAAVCERYARGRRRCPSCSGRGMIRVRQVPAPGFQAAAPGEPIRMPDQPVEAECERCHGTGQWDDALRERAEFIRVQCALAGTEPGPDLGSLCRRERELLDARYGDWYPFPGVPDGWDRGFVSGLQAISAADWLTHGDAVLSHHPVTRVRPTTPWAEGEPWPMRLASRYPYGGGFFIAGQWAAVEERDAMLLPPAAQNAAGLAALALGKRWPGVVFEGGGEAAGRWDAVPDDDEVQQFRERLLLGTWPLPG